VERWLTHCSLKIDKKAVGGNTWQPFVVFCEGSICPVISREAKPRAGFPDWGSWQRNALTDEVNLIIPNTLPTLSF
jgi:hypothetical protein